MTYALVPAATANQRTTLNFIAHGNPWPIIEAWAPTAGFREISGKGMMTRVYQKGHGLFVAPMMLAISTDGGAQVMMQAWVRANLFVRLMSFFILPAEMHIRSGGFRAVLPRKIARDAINPLLNKLGQQPIP